MALGVGLGPLPLGRRRAARVGELERIFATAVELIEVVDVAAFAAAMEMHDVSAAALDASVPEISTASSQPRDLGQSFDRSGGATESAG